MGVKQLAAGGKQWSGASASPCSLAVPWWGRGSCLGLLPAPATRGVWALQQAWGEGRSGQHPQEMPKSSPSCYYSVSLSWFLALVFQVLPLCGLLNKSLTSCPFSWQGCWGWAASLCPSPRLSISSDHVCFFQHLHRVPFCPACSRVLVPFGSPGAAGWALVAAVCFTLQLRMLEPAQGEVCKHPVCKL